MTGPFAAAVTRVTQPPHVSPTADSFIQTLDTQIGGEEAYVNHGTSFTPCFYQSHDYNNT